MSFESAMYVRTKFKLQFQIGTYNAKQQQKRRVFTQNKFKMKNCFSQTFFLIFGTWHCEYQGKLHFSTKNSSRYCVTSRSTLKRGSSLFSNGRLVLTPSPPHLLLQKAFLQYKTVHPREETAQLSPNRGPFFTWQWFSW